MESIHSSLRALYDSNGSGVTKAQKEAKEREWARNHISGGSSSFQPWTENASVSSNFHHRGIDETLVSRSQVPMFRTPEISLNHSDSTMTLSNQTFIRPPPPPPPPPPFQVPSEKSQFEDKLKSLHVMAHGYDILYDATRNSTNNKSQSKVRNKKSEKARHKAAEFNVHLQSAPKGSTAVADHSGRTNLSFALNQRTLQNDWNTASLTDHVTGKPFTSVVTRFDALNPPSVLYGTALGVPRPQPVVLNHPFQGSNFPIEHGRTQDTKDVWPSNASYSNKDHHSRFHSNSFLSHTPVPGTMADQQKDQKNVSTSGTDPKSSFSFPTNGDVRSVFKQPLCPLDSCGENAYLTRPLDDMSEIKPLASAKSENSCKLNGVPSPGDEYMMDIATDTPAKDFNMLKSSRGRIKFKSSNGEISQKQKLLDFTPAKNFNLLQVSSGQIQNKTPNSLPSVFRTKSWNPESLRLPTRHSLSGEFSGSDSFDAPPCGVAKMFSTSSLDSIPLSITKSYSYYSKHNLLDISPAKDFNFLKVSPGPIKSKTPNSEMSRKRKLLRVFSDSMKEGDRLLIDDQNENMLPVLGHPLPSQDLNNINHEAALIQMPSTETKPTKSSQLTRTKIQLLKAKSRLLLAQKKKVALLSSSFDSRDSSSPNTTSDGQNISSKDMNDDLRSQNSPHIQNIPQLLDISAIGMPCLIIENIRESGPSEMIRFNHSHRLKFKREKASDDASMNIQLSSSFDVDRKDFDDSISPRMMNAKKKSLDLKLELARRRLKLKLMEQSKKDASIVSADIVAEGAVLELVGSNIPTVPDSSSQPALSLESNQEIKEGGVIENEPQMVEAVLQVFPSDSETLQPSYDTTTSLRLRQRRLQEIIDQSRETQKELQRHHAIGELTNVVDKQREMLLDQGERIKENALNLKDCLKRLEVEKSSIRSCEAHIEDLSNRKQILENMVLDITQKLIAARRIKGELHGYL